MKYLDFYHNLQAKDPNMSLSDGWRVILEYDTTNAYGEATKVSSVFPPQTLVAPILKAEFDSLLSNRVHEMVLAGMLNINIHDQQSDKWKDYIRNLKT